MAMGGCQRRWAVPDRLPGEPCSAPWLHPAPADYGFCVSHSPAYAVWSGLGASGTAINGMLLPSDLVSARSSRSLVIAGP